MAKTVYLRYVLLILGLSTGYIRANKVFVSNNTNHIVEVWVDACHERYFSLRPQQKNASDILKNCKITNVRVTVHEGSKEITFSRSVDWDTSNLLIEVNESKSATSQSLYHMQLSRK